MKKTILMVQIALHFAEMKVLALIPFAQSIYDNAGADPDVVVDPASLTTLKAQFTALSSTVAQRVTNKSKSLTTLEAKQATDVILTLTDISVSVEKQANAISPGDTARATLAIERIGFNLYKPRALPGRTFEIYKLGPGEAWVRVKRDKEVNLHHWRYSADDKTWIRLPDTTTVSVNVINLPKTSEAYFQSASTKKVKGIPVLDLNDMELEWSDSISATIPS